MSNKWDTGKTDKCIKDCDYSDKFEAGKLFITPEIQAVTRKLCDSIKDEWQILLKGKAVNGDMVCDGYYIPKQEVTSSSVKNLDCIDADFIKEHSIVATIHSHSNMGVFFSSVDEEKTNLSPINYHVVVNNKGDYKAVFKFELPCGLVTMLDVKMTLLSQVGEIELEGVENIKKEVTIDKRYNEYNEFSRYNRDIWDDDYLLDNKKHALDVTNSHLYNMYKGGE